MSGFRWTARGVEAALGVAAEGEDRPYARISTDTRRLGEETLFVALVGDNFDGHAFLGQAADGGATGAVVARVPEHAPATLRYFVVEDTRHALGRLARHRRRTLTAPVIGVAGSNGKTTTKDLLRAALGTRFRVHATEANLNNQVGVPLTLLAAPDEAEAVVVEMGTNEPGEIALLTRIVEPDIALITSIGEEHLEKLGSLEGVLEEELAVLDGVRPSGVALVSDEPPALAERARTVLGERRLGVVGLSERADVRPATDPTVLENGSTRWRWRDVDVTVPLPGMHNVRNALLALAVAEELGVAAADAAAGIAAIGQPKLRNEWLEIAELRVLADCYNANPPSVAAAVDLLAALPARGRKVAVLGTMRELGEQTRAMHDRGAEAVAARVGQGIDTVVATGEWARAFEPYATKLGDALVRDVDPMTAYDVVGPGLAGDETILLKGSRGEALERWIPLLERDFKR